MQLIYHIDGQRERERERERERSIWTETTTRCFSSVRKNTQTHRDCRRERASERARSLRCRSVLRINSDNSHSAPSDLSSLSFHFNLYLHSRSDLRYVFFFFLLVFYKYCASILNYQLIQCFSARNLWSVWFPREKKKTKENKKWKWKFELVICIIEPK